MGLTWASARVPACDEENLVTTPLFAPATAVLAAVANPVNTTGADAILGSILGIAFLAVAIKAVFHAFKGGIAAVLTIVVIVLVGATIWGLDEAGMLPGLGTTLAHSIFNG
jgi:predicted lipid-binding transport protein (Tim44 family)